MASELEVGKLKVAASDGAGGLVHENASGIKVGTDSNTTIGFIGTISNHPLKLLANNDGKVTIDASGRVGVGVAPGAKLHVSSGTTNNIADDLSEIRFIGPDKAITGEQANVVIQTNDDFAINKGGSIGLGGRHTTSSTNGANFAQISGRKENATTANFAGYLAFSTSDAASDIHERMRISSTGAVQIGADDIQGDAKLGVRRNGDAFNFGHVNGAGYGSNLGCGNNNGHPYVAFSAESGTNDNTFKTRGLLGNVIQATATGELKFSQVTNANADNQTATDRLTIDSTGLATFSAGVTVSGGFLSLESPTELTIASGAVTVTKSFHDVDTEGDAATDDLDTINGGSAGDILTLKTVTGSRDVTVKDATGNLRLAGDFTLTSPNDTITLIKYSTVWIETSRSDNN